MSVIDFKKLPVDTLVDVSTSHGCVVTAYFKEYHEAYGDKPFVTFDIGGSSLTRPNGECLYSKIRISAKNPWLPWFGGECPVPEGCMVEVKRRILGYRYLADYAERFEWSSEDGPDDIIAYRLLESPWQTVDGVCE